LPQWLFGKQKFINEMYRTVRKRNQLLVSTDGSGLPGGDRGILTKVAQKYEHVGDNHDSTYALGLEAKRKATVTSVQATTGTTIRHCKQADVDLLAPRSGITVVW